MEDTTPSGASASASTGPFAARQRLPWQPVSSSRNTTTPSVRSDCQIASTAASPATTPSAPSNLPPSGPDLRQLRRAAGQPPDDVAPPVHLDLEARLLEPPGRQRTGFVLFRRPADPVRPDAVPDVENVIQPPF